MATAKERAAAALAEAEVEEKITAAVPPDARVHVRDLHGTVASLAYGDNFRIREPHDRPDPEGPVSWERAVELAELLPPIAMVDVRDGRSFQPAEYVSALPAAKTDRLTIAEVAPIRVDLGAFPCEHGRGFKPHASARWFARVEGVGLVEVKVDLGAPPEHVVEYTVTRSKYMGGVRYKDAGVRFHQSLNIYDDYEGEWMGEHRPVGEVIAMAESPIRWWSSQDYPAEVSIVWTPINRRRDPAVCGLRILQRIADLAAGRQGRGL